MTCLLGGGIVWSHLKESIPRGENENWSLLYSNNTAQQVEMQNGVGYNNALVSGE